MSRRADPVLTANPFAGCLLLVAGVAMTGCLAVQTPSAGKPLPVVQGKALVFGRAMILDHDRVAPPANPGSDWLDVGPGLLPELSIYLLRLSPRRIARPQFTGPGAFYWFLAPGDYLFVGSPAADAGEPEFAQHHWLLAAMRVLPMDTLVCAGELSIETAGASIALRPEPVALFDLGAVRVTDRCADLTAELEARFAAAGRPPVRRMLVVATELDFDDPGLFDRVRMLLDGAAAGRGE